MNHINRLFEIMVPDEAQKEKMRLAIEQQSRQVSQPARKLNGQPLYRKILVSLSVIALALVISATAYAAVSGSIEKMYDSLFHGKGQTVTFANGDTLHYVVEENGSTAGMGGDGDGPWLVKKSWGRLMLSVNGHRINIKNALQEKGYYLYRYRDDAGILHHLYIVKNAGGVKDYAERWYSQLEWLPELGMAGGWRGLSGPLSDAIVWSEIDAEGGKDLDAALQERLAKYWKEYGN
ncbi:hypothetical protein [Paenibacillus protaetiae]|uniref:Uncharacterized protein n=1 Tax=Paenibacillus protaetiae TaxID=2509456 RepID=A0A4V0YFG4_9BACL|nr:hypothetical protein [Paenibacillus protaetiae]QAY67621.1 hypothetical protein ET464_15770 [Paenibacillus protaetiae]